ncbi:MAG: hypothetical protein FWC70_05345 [Defluviitaleaceae bacterium]|nr:hypothetical protein [Defluviitaleaceae bacterium]
MEQLLVAREEIVKFFKRYEIFIMPALKFLLGIFIFTSINSIGHSHESVAPLMGSVAPWLLTFLFAVLFVVMPMNLSWVVIILLTTLQFSANAEAAIAVFVFLLLIFLFYARMATRESIIIIFTLIAFRFNMPYLVPLVVGLYFPVTAVIPVTVGVFLQAQFAGLSRLISPTAVTTPAAAVDRDIVEVLGDIPDAFSDVYSAIMGSFTGHHTWIFTAIVFAMVIVLVHFVSRLKIDYAKEIAIGLGCVMTVFGFIIAVIYDSATVNIGIVILGTLIGGALAIIIRFFDGILDYQRAEAVQFEDDKNYYHVRIVPKVIMTKSQRSVKRIRPDAPEEEEEDTPAEG